MVLEECGFAKCRVNTAPSLGSKPRQVSGLLADMRKYRKRIADEILSFKLEEAGAALVEGVKWCGETTTSEQLAKSTAYIDDILEDARLQGRRIRWRGDEHDGRRALGTRVQRRVGRGLPTVSVDRLRPALNCEEPRPQASRHAFCRGKGSWQQGREDDLEFLDTAAHACKSAA